MTSISVLENIHEKGLFGEHESKEQKDLIKILPYITKKTKIFIS